nr:hypothetical protein [uncultured Brevundimonas sp.]
MSASIHPAAASIQAAENQTTMPYAHVEAALPLVASDRQHRVMVPFLVSGLRKQAPFMNGQAMMLEILCSAACLADLPMKPRAAA